MPQSRAGSWAPQRRVTGPAVAAVFAIVATSTVRMWVGALAVLGVTAVVYVRDRGWNERVSRVLFRGFFLAWLSGTAYLLLHVVLTSR